MPSATDVLGWAQVVAALVQLGMVTGQQIATVVALLKKAEGKTDVDYAPEDAALSAETHAILADIIAKAR